MHNNSVHIYYKIYVFVVHIFVVCMYICKYILYIKIGLYDNPDDTIILSFSSFIISIMVMS